jgi:F-type H+-transporting ATPase subunit b
MFEINGTLVIFVVSFLVYMMLLNEIMLKPVGRVLDKRNARVSGDQEAAKASRRQAAELVDKYESDVKRIRHESHELITRSLEEATKQKSTELASVQREGSQKFEEAKAEITAERAALIDDLVTQERELVELITQKVLGENVSVQLDASKVRRTLEEAC